MHTCDVHTFARTDIKDYYLKYTLCNNNTTKTNLLQEKRRQKHKKQKLEENYIDILQTKEFSREMQCI